MINVLEYLQYSALQYPDKTAYADETRSVTFQELDCQARRLATRIVRQVNGQTNVPVGVFLEKSVNAVVSFMAVVYSGNFYVPFDISAPAVRFQNILSVLQPACIITSQKHDEELTQKTDGQYSLLTFETALETEPDNIVLQQIQNRHVDTNPLYVLFTSGSTGIPKGVVISHRSVIDYIEWVTQTFSIDSKTIFGNQAPFYFDNSILDIYSTLKNSSTMYIIPEMTFIFPPKLLSYLQEKQINTIFWVPSALVSVANAKILHQFPLPHLQKILFCGEVMPTKQLNVWRKNLPSALYANLYGPTEITDVCSYYIIDREFQDDEPLPIGFPCTNTDIFLIHQGTPVAHGEIGELCVRGTCLSLGYYGNPEKTREVFIQNPLQNHYQELIYCTGDLAYYNEQGELMYAGRKDFQIKHMGHRIELGEIETAASAIAGIRRTCALYDQKAQQIILICETDLSDQKLIYQQCKQRLPKYMIPSIIHCIDAMPLNANKKIDRVQLAKTYFEGDL